MGASKTWRRFEAEERERLKERVLELIDRGTTERRIARRLGISKGLINIFKKERPPEPRSDWTRQPSAKVRHITELNARLEPGRVNRFIVTEWQPSPIFEPFLENLFAYALHRGATLLVGGNPRHARQCPADLRPYFVTERVRITDSLVFIGRSDKPTATDPLKDHLTANHGQHVLVPHNRFALQSLPRLLSDPPRYVLSTGSVSLPSPTETDMRRLAHYANAATLVEIDTDGEIFFHQMTANVDGSFQCLGDFVQDGAVHGGCSVRAITWGDAHHDIMEQQVGLASFGYDRRKRAYVGCANLLDTLHPEDQFFSDLIHFGYRNPHVISDPVKMAQAFHAGNGNIEQEIAEAAAFVNLCRRKGSTVNLKEGNHERKLLKWLRDSKGRSDPENSYYYHHLNAVLHKAIRDTKGAYRETDLIGHALREQGLADDVRLLRSGESYKIDGVEMAVHADRGIKGSPGNPAQFRKFGTEITLDHPHAPLACEGVMVAGTSGAIFQGYNHGPTTDAHAHVVQYYDGKRGLILMTADGRYRAVGDALELAQAA